MTDEAKPEDTVETIAKETAAEPAKTETKEPEKTPDGTDFVEIEDPKVAARFRRLYGHVKSLERGNDALREHSALLQKKLEEITGLVETGQTVAAAKQIKEQLVAAKQRGDAPAEVELTDRLSRLNAAPRQPAALPQLPPAETMELVEARAWESETGADGNFLRPWAQPAHPEFDKAMNIARTLMTDPTIGTDINRVLGEIDRRMGVKRTQPRRPGPANVMSSDARPPRGELPELSSEQLGIARKMGIDPKAYAQQLKLINRGAAR